MKFWLCGVLAFATFVHIETTPTYEERSKHRIHTRGLDDIRVEFSSGIEPYEAKDGNETNIFDPIEVNLEGRYFWERIYYIDNRKKNNTYRETLNISKIVTTSYSELTKSVIDASVKISLSIEGGVKWHIVSATVKNSLDVQVSTSYERTIEKKEESTVTRYFSREFTVGPDSIGEMFRLNFQGPGVTYATDTISTDGNLNITQVIINCKVERVPLIQDIVVVSTLQSIDRPNNIIKETNGGNPDINFGHGGNYVWLVPVWTDSVAKAVTDIQVVIQDDSNDAYKDMGDGAGGKYRYLKMLREQFSLTRIRRIGLLRSKKYIVGNRRDHGWDECTGDINEDREGDWLHLCWNTISTAYTF